MGGRLDVIEIGKREGGSRRRRDDVVVVLKCGLGEKGSCRFTGWSGR